MQGTHWVRKGIEYFVTTYDESRQVWQIIPPEAAEAPHAPWWHYESSAETFGQFLVNPRVEIIGYLHEFSDGVPTKLLEQLTTTVLEHLDSPSSEMEMHDILCFARLAETEALPNRDKVWETLAQVAAPQVARNAEQLTGYVLKPLWLVSSPESPLAAGLKDEVEMNLDFEIEQQGEDGSWSPNFSWGDQYPETWQKAKKEWQSRFTVETLKTLRDFGRIEQVDQIECRYEYHILDTRNLMNTTHEQGKIILINGASSSGKSTLARELQQTLPMPFWHFSFDHLRDSNALPMARIRSGDIDWSTIRPTVFDGFHRCLPVLAEAGNNLIVDHIIENEMWMSDLVTLLTGLDVFFVGVHCPLPGT